MVCYGLFVFFFKQKTAYDMRISDWSSDVCSSDLEAVLAAAEAELQKAEANVAATSARARRYQELVGANAVSRQNYDDAVAAQKIGRASCRESVCQYV